MYIANPIRAVTHSVLSSVLKAKVYIIVLVNLLFLSAKIGLFGLHTILEIMLKLMALDTTSIVGHTVHADSKDHKTKDFVF